MFFWVVTKNPAATRYAFDTFWKAYGNLPSKIVRGFTQSFMIACKLVGTCQFSNLNVPDY
ncbi:MAG: hypothetical protein BGO78_11315 [Chloroflexi bacterium 44-23]|nr:MAG: hypothetical protein BGO78_11315 [Chloroflexi bacterium 44-23]